MNDLAKQSKQIQTIDPETLILKAVESNVPVETMERLLSMRAELKEEQAKEAFYTALSLFQRKCPIIRKEREVRGKDGGVRYRYASLDDIVKQIAPLLEECGLSYTVDTKHKKEGFISVILEIHHLLGYSKLSEFDVPIEETAFMNDAQKAGSALTYAKRYAFCNAFGIMTGDQDDDAQSLGKGIDPNELYKRFRRHMDAVWENLASVRTIKAIYSNPDLTEEDRAWKVAECLEELDDQVQMDLNLAPTKGGVFTTKERGYLKSDEVAEARRSIKADKLDKKQNEDLP